MLVSLWDKECLKPVDWRKVTPGKIPRATFSRKMDELIGKGFVKKRGTKYCLIINKKNKKRLGNISRGFLKIEDRKKIEKSSTPFRDARYLISDFLFYHQKLMFLLLSNTIFKEKSEKVRLRNQIKNTENTIKKILEILNKKDPKRTQQVIDYILDKMDWDNLVSYRPV